MKDNLSWDNLILVLEELARQTEHNLVEGLQNAGKDDSRIIQMCGLTVNADKGSIYVESELPDYAIWVDQGRGPGKMPPIEVLREWCNRKGIDESAAFPIGLNIAREGIPPTHFLDPLREFANIVAESLGDPAQKDIVTYFENIKKNYFKKQ